MAEKKDGGFLRWIAQPEVIIGLSALVVSVVAVSVSAYETAIMRDWQRAAVWPFVQLSRSYYVDGKALDPLGRATFTLNAENVGVGPAQIRDFRVLVDGVPQPDWKATIKALLKTDEEIDYGQSTINGAILPAGRLYRIFEVDDSADAEKIADAMTGRLDYEACYCSVFGECWRTTYSDFGGAEKVERCERGADSFTE